MSTYIWTHRRWRRKTPPSPPIYRPRTRGPHRYQDDDLRSHLRCPRRGCPQTYLDGVIDR